METRRVQLGVVQWGIILLTLVTAFIHFYLNVLMGKIDLMFTLNGLGYLALLAALFLPHPLLVRNRSIIRILFMGYTLLTILAWVFMGERSLIGYIDKITEVALLVFLWLDRDRG